MKRLLFAFTAMATSLLWAQECTHLWNYTLEINGAKPKPFSGDTYAVYGLIGFYDEPNLRLQFTGEFPSGRFMSLESYKTMDKNHMDVLFDYQIEPNAGSENPYREGVMMETPNRSYTVDLVKEGTEIAFTNALKLSADEDVHSVFYRAYVPSEGVVPTKESLPKIFAFNARTGAPAACPKVVDTEFNAGLKAILLHFIPQKKKLAFKVKTDFDNGTNAGIPGYAYVASKTPMGRVSVVRFKAPTFFNTQSGAGPFQHTGDVRYWSFCTNNVKVNETLNCLADYVATPDKDGFVTVVVGGGEKVKTAAEKKGFNYLEDRREGKQKVAIFIYRNLLPVKGFPVYEDDYLPSGIVCKAEEFLSGSCEL